MKPIAGAVLAACALAAHAQADPWQLRIEAARESLDRGHADWREELAQLAYRPQAGRSIFGGYRRTERFGAEDREGFAGAYLPVPGLGGTVLRLEATASPTHHVLPRRTYLAEAIQPLGGGWVASAGGRRLRYSTDVTWAWVGIERYLGPYRLAYLAQVSRPDGAGWAPAHRVSASWYRGELTFVTLTASRGRELESVFGVGLLQTDVRGAFLAAGLELTPRWGLLLELGWARQGDLYTRRAARIGTRFHF